jgi:hypothetical protein
VTLIVRLCDCGCSFTRTQRAWFSKVCAFASFFFFYYAIGDVFALDFVGAGADKADSPGSSLIGIVREFGGV